MINTFFTILIFVFIITFAIGSSIMIALDKKAKGPGKFDKQGQVKYTKGDNT
tara:strand:- start:465 stop:620 length:156 start_codon:yes stop_codon:yes gene_type:complete